MRFGPSATVGDVNRLLGAIDATIAGQIGTTGLLMITIPDRPDATFADLKAALALLRADPAVELAAMDTLGESATLNPPPPPSLRDPAPGSRPPYLGFDPGPYPGTTNGSYGLVQGRFPQAWNLLETIARRSPAAVQVAVLDSSFDTEHPEFSERPGSTPAIELQTQCVALVVCDRNDPFRVVLQDPLRLNGDHGTSVAGIVGGANTGTNPRARVVAVPNPSVPLTPWSAGGASFVGSISAVSDLIAEKRPGGRVPDLRVVNLSNHGVTFEDKGATWARSFRNSRCGPGAQDDGDAVTESCTPNNEDGYLAEMANLGRAAQVVARRASDRDVVIVQSSGNMSGELGNFTFCVPYTVPKPGCTYEPIQASSSGEFAWASAHWTGPEANPILAVDAVLADGSRAPFSNIGGDVSAGSAGVSAPRAGGGYYAFGGTSASAPFVSGLASLLAGLDPGLSAGQIRNLIKVHAHADTTGGAAPRIDAYATLLAVPGALRSVLDMNDPSSDGNRRTIRFRAGSGLDDQQDTVLGDTVGGEQMHAAPDGVVGMRDFRRYRDAWLQVCRDQPLPACPPRAQIRLDGSVLKQDLNFDGQYRGASEALYPRMDPAGVGSMSYDPLVGRGRVPIDTRGEILPGGPDRLVDGLELFQLLWGQRADGSSSENEGYAKSHLPSLLTSGDVEVQAKDLFDDPRIDEATVSVSYSNDGGTHFTPAPTQILRRDARPADGFLRVVTVPISSATGTARIRAWVSGTVDGKTVRSLTATGTVGIGGDIRLDPCVVRPHLSLNPRRLSGRQKAELALRLDACGVPIGPGGRAAADEAGRIAAADAEDEAEDDPIGTPAGLTVDFTAEGTGTDPADPEIVREDTEIGADGTATAEIDTGDDTGTAEFEATVTFADGGTTTIGLTSDIGGAPRLVYRWQQEVDHDGRQSQQVDPDVLDGLFSFTETPSETNPPPVTMTREGTLDLGDFTLDETYGAGAHGLERTYEGGGGYDHLFRVEEGNDRVDVPVNDLVDPLGTTALPDIGMYETDSHLTVMGLRVLGDLIVGYEECAADGSTCRDDGFGGGTYQDVGGYGPLRLGPRRALYPWDDAQGGYVYRGGDGTAFQLAPDLDADLRIARNADGSFRPYSYCGTGDFAFPDHLEEDGDVFAEVTGGGRYETSFVATVVTGDTDPDLELPDCSNPAPPEARFTSEPDPGLLGEVTQFTDASEAPSGIASWSWDFGDGATSTDPDPTHRYDFDGFYTVKLTVTDGRGVTDSYSELIEVRPSAPTAELPDAVADAGPVTIQARIDSPSELARYGLRVRVTSTNPRFAGGPERSHPAGVIDLDLGVMVPGVHPLTLTVTDHLGQTGVAHGTVVVVEPPERPADRAAGGAPTSVDRPARAAAAGAGVARPAGPAGSARSGAAAVGPSAVEAALPDGPVPAVTITDATPATGAAVRVENQTRAGGVGWRPRSTRATGATRSPSARAGRR